MNQVIPETAPDYDRTRLLERPDGFYWRRKGTAREYGPFATLLETVHDIQAADESTPEPGEALEDVEAELGIASWIDPDTGEPAEEERPRIVEH